ncbi:MAG: YHS domain-containing (seleno)protein [Cyanobacteria bacterium J06623_4]
MITSKRDRSPHLTFLPKLLTSAIALSLGLSACTPNAPTAVDPATDAAGSSDAAETAATAADSGTLDSGAKIFVKDGIAISGADPVAYFTDAAFVPGSSEFAHEWKGATWQFATAENRDHFAENPEQYAPQFGGYCAWAVGQNALAAIDPNAWSIVDDKLYLNANQRIQNRWSKDIPGNIALAEANWPTLSAQ